MFCFSKDRGNPANDGQRDGSLQRIWLHLGNKSVFSLCRRNGQPNIIEIIRLVLAWSLQMPNVQRRLWSSWMASSWRAGQWRWDTWRSARTRQQPAPSWTTTSWRELASTSAPQGDYSWWPGWQKVWVSALSPYSKIQNVPTGFVHSIFPSLGTGLKIPPAAQQALQMTGSMPFGNMPGPAGGYFSSFVVYLFRN